jgi:hypothetical protein
MADADATVLADVSAGKVASMDEQRSSTEVHDDDTHRRLADEL